VIDVDRGDLTSRGDGQDEQCHRVRATGDSAHE
jgi:hypothetical protein